MIIWFSSESTTAVSREFFPQSGSRGACNEFETAINRHLPKIKIPDWKKWRVIFIIMPDEDRKFFKETNRLTRKDMTLDFRVAIDYEASKTASFTAFIDLMVPALEKTLPYFKKAGIGIEIQNQIRDCVRLAAEDVKASVATKQ